MVEAPEKRRSASTRVYETTSQKSVFFILAAVRTLYLTLWLLIKWSKSLNWTWDNKVSDNFPETAKEITEKTCTPLHVIMHTITAMPLIVPREWPDKILWWVRNHNETLHDTIILPPILNEIRCGITQCVQTNIEILSSNTPCLFTSTCRHNLCVTSFRNYVTFEANIAL
jgi:hypothetical protein